jgi:hypothetical protein
MPVDPMFWMATATFAWGLSLATYRWFALHNGWPMGEWQAHRPGLPIAIGLFSMLFAVLFAIARGGNTMFVMPLLGVMCALVWTAITRVGAQSALLLAPASVVALMVYWLLAASHVAELDGASLYRPGASSLERPAATAREGDINDRDRGITRTEPRGSSPLPR